LAFSSSKAQLFTGTAKVPIIKHVIKRNEKVLRTVKEDRNILHTINRRKANWIGHSLRRNCLLKHIMEGKLEGKIEMTGRRGRRRKQLTLRKR
jgi:hypothetical protein